MNISQLVHLKNVYQGFLVIPQHNGVDVFRKNGEHVLCVRDGKDLSEMLNCTGRLSLDPIPKDGRVLSERDGKVVPHQLAEKRLELRKKFVCEVSGRLLSISELKVKGWAFNEDGVVTAEPAAA